MVFGRGIVVLELWGLKKGGSWWRNGSENIRHTLIHDISVVVFLKKISGGGKPIFREGGVL